MLLCIWNFLIDGLMGGFFFIYFIFLSKFMLDVCFLRYRGIWIKPNSSVGYRFVLPFWNLYWKDLHGDGLFGRAGSCAAVLFFRK